MYWPSCGTPNEESRDTCGLPLRPVPNQPGAPGPASSPPQWPVQPSYGYAQPGLSYAGIWKRFVAVIIDGIVVNIVAGLTQRKQALHDMIAGTLVVNEH